MAKLTNRQANDLAYVLRHMERAQTYIAQADIVIARKGRVASTSLHYTRADGSALYEVTKEYGSDLCALDTSIKALRNFMFTPVTV